MIKVLIVDDETLVRVGIKSSVEWEKLGFEIVGEAQNGMEALEKIERLKPDILIMDIKMPVMDGISVLKTLNGTGKEIHTLILSCYSDFEYVKNAMKYGAKDYIVKLSMETEELVEILCKFKEDIEKNRNSRKENELVNYNITEIKKEFFKRLFEGEYTNKERLQNIQRNLQIEVSKQDMILGILQIDNFNSIFEQAGKEERNLLKSSAAGIIDDVVCKYEFC